MSPTGKQSGQNVGVDKNGAVMESNINVPMDKFIDHSQFGNFETNYYTYEIVETISKYLLDRTTYRPRIGIICGSGLGQLADGLNDSVTFKYESIPHFPTSTVRGHAGRLVFGKLEDIEVMCMQGRFHCYEGYPLWKCSMPVRLMKLIGVTHLIITNAAGGLNPGFKVGDIMIIKDHINMMGFAGNSALNGPNDDRFGPRFPAMNRAYDQDLRKEALKVAKELKIDKIVKEGVYTCLGGPNYETIAELRMLRTCGVDAVGMSTIPEAIIAKHCEINVFAFSLITNTCIMEYESFNELTLDEILATGDERAPIMRTFVAMMVKRINDKIQTILKDQN